MNLTIDELERRLYIEGRMQERAALLEFEAAFDSAIDYLEDPDGLDADAIASAPFTSTRPML